MAILSIDQLETFYRKRSELRDEFYREAINYIESREMCFSSPVASAILGNCEKKLTKAAMAFVAENTEVA